MLIDSKLPDTATTIFTTMSRLAVEHQAINLSQGFPDFECAPELVDLVTKYMREGYNQYAPMAGAMRLREAIAEKQYVLHQANYSPESEVTVTAGGTQAIFTAISASVRTGDEVIIFEPAYDSYEPSVILAGGSVRRIVLQPPYTINWDDVRAAVNENTRMIILNSPGNPTGRVLDADDIRQLIQIVTGTRILILSDEVYEHLTYPPHSHLSMSAFPELKARSFITASFGKLFHTTGWKVGYCLAPQELMSEFRKVHQFLIFSVNTPVQYAIADYLSNPDNYLQLSGFFREKKDFFASLLAATRFDILPCQGSYFQCVGYSRISAESDKQLAHRLTTDHGVASIPVSAFYKQENDFGVLRFCFAKKQETLEKAVERLASV